MKNKIIMLMFILANTLIVVGQNNAASIYEIDSMKGLSREEMYEKYAYDDTSRALINKYYSTHAQALVLGGVGAAITAGTGALTWFMLDILVNGNVGFGAIYLIPAIALGTGATIFFAGVTGASFTLAQSKTKLLLSLKSYKEKGELTAKERRWIPGYMPKR
jgi:hypothetical protein